MILDSIELQNFRSYYGKQLIRFDDRATDTDRNIAVLGGLNGAGKTSLLEAIIFTLLGVQDAFKFIEETERKGSGRNQIDRTLDGLLNREARERGERDTRVRLVFRDRDGFPFTVERVWTYDYRGQFKDSVLYVETDRELEPDQYDDFITNRIPKEVARFFFFDGEKIQTIAQDEIGAEVLKGIDSLLGFHLLDSLAGDMEKMQDEYRKEAKKRNRQEEELVDLRSKRTRLSNQINELEGDRAELEETVDKLKEQNSVLVDELNQLLGGKAGSPKELQRQLDDANDTIRQVKDQILEDVDRRLTPVLPTELLSQLADQIEGEGKRAQWEEGRRRVEPQRNLLVARVFGDSAPAPTPPLSDDQAIFLKQRVREEWSDLFNPPPEGIAAELIHEYLSDEERTQVRNKCQQVLRAGGTDIQAPLNRLDTAERRARDVRQQLEQIGDSERANEIIEEKSRVDRELGEAEQAWESHKRKIQALRTDLREIDRNIDNKEQELDRSGASDDKASFVRKVKRVIQQYQERLRPKKRDDVARYLTEMYRRLARKEDVVDRIELDEKTYRPRLLDRRGRAMPLHSLSAGEREIYALSLLWALGKSSRRELPVVIDTPLARLDSEHRTNIVTKYLPAAGPQVIVLSTDTELDRDNFALIEDRVSTSLHLDFDPGTERTTVREGYFRFS